MSIQLNHTILAARDARSSAGWYAELFGLEAPEHLPPFWQVTTANEVNLDFIDHDPAEYGEIEPRHLAFLIAEDDFDAIFGKVLERGIGPLRRPAQAAARRDQPPRRRAGRLLRRPRRPLARDHHRAVRRLVAAARRGSLRANWAVACQPRTASGNVGCQATVSRRRWLLTRSDRATEVRRWPSRLRPAPGHGSMTCGAPRSASASAYARLVRGSSSTTL